MLNVKKLQAIRDKILGVTVDPRTYGDLNSVVYLQQILDALNGVTSTPARVRGNLHEKMYLQQIRDAILGTSPASTNGMLSNSVYLQQILSAFQGGIDIHRGSLSDQVYLDLILANAHPLSSGKTPNQIATLTGWWDASDASKMYTDAGITLVSADGNLVYRLADKSGLAGNRYLQQATLGARPLYKLNRQNGKSGLLFDGSNDVMQTVAFAISNFIANNAMTLFCVFNPLVISTNAANIINNDCIVTDIGGGGYFGIYLKSVPTAHYYNYDGTNDITSHAIASPAPILFTAWHSGGNIISQVNNGAVQTVVSGNTSNLTGNLCIGGSATQFLNGDFYEMALYNTYIGDADRLLLNQGLMSKWGL